MEKALLDFNPFGDSEPFPGETLVADGWKYKDFEKMPAEDWEQLLALYGDGNFRLITSASYKKDGQVLKRGQMFVSPQGLANERFYKSLNSGMAFSIDPNLW